MIPPPMFSVRGALLLFTALAAAAAHFAVAPRPPTDAANLIPRPAADRILQTALGHVQSNLAFSSPYANVPDFAISAATVLERARDLVRDLQAPPPSVQFLHGVASGDPLEDRVILWTKVTPNTADNVTVSLNYVVASDGNLTSVVKNGTAATSSDVGYTVKVDVPDLNPATRYWYQFRAGDAVSPTGTTLTLPARNATLDRVQFAVTSCSNFQHGYFHAYGAIANRSTDFQALLGVGDGIYEYSSAGYPPAGGELPPDRDPVPDKNLDTLDEYRTRYSQYQTDVSQQAMMRSLPIIAIWDDHEFADNAWSINATNGNVSAPGGANNQNDRRDGPWGERRLAAMRAFHENIPIRPSNATGAQYRIYRSFRIGTMVDLLMLDTRMEGRDEQGSGRDANRELMGPEQEAWLHAGLINSNATWRVIGNQVMFANQPNQLLWYEPPIANDAWVGYPAPRQRLLDVMVQNKVNNTIMVTGDFHASVASNIPYRGNDRASPIVFTEFVTPSVTARTPASDSQRQSEYFSEILKRSNPGAQWIDMYRHGYVALKLTANEARAEYWYVQSVKGLAPSDMQTYLNKTLVVPSGANRITAVE
ncbi:hypothetical protein AMAG_14207 [Allomyces macrogynus ATCC 38327]|uniref:PhoD-like phosphatase metallophosphatase domain-containing protein n=1 Tax=Allomyces macrogynus (strain ATCC 38327) TaxID=578462 RepID=A0A0L0T4I6_ALLM3|nr:hypothetical protein AMAG_14207 [Allomyces macrogynus ATCC 38327]|eukprot:KNE69652.1 hypothetical protein AMAG_14207 [Allomyces macrogynus ATCC 38327]